MSLGGGGGGGEIPKRGRAGRARSLGIWPGGARSRVGETAGTRAHYMYSRFSWDPASCRLSNKNFYF